MQTHTLLDPCVLMDQLSCSSIVFILGTSITSEVTVPFPGLVLGRDPASFSSSTGIVFAKGCFSAIKGRDADDARASFDNRGPCCLSVGQLFELVGLETVLGPGQWR